MAIMGDNTGRLHGFQVRSNGDVILEVSDIEDPYLHYVTITAAELAGIAEASAVRRQSSEPAGR